MRYLVPLLLLLSAYAAFSPFAVDIYTEVGVDGTGVTREQYFVSERNEVEDLSRTLGFRYELWRDYVEDMRTHMCREPSDVKLTISYRDESAIFTIEYSCPVAELLEEGITSNRYIVRSLSLKPVSGLMVLPEGYTVSIRLPPGALLEEVSPEPYSVSGNTVTWKGRQEAPRFYVVYSLRNITEAPRALQLLESNVPLMLLLVLLIVSLFAIPPIRRKIEKLVQDSFRPRKGV